MEYALWACWKVSERICLRRLNPYSNGICSLRNTYYEFWCEYEGLNPYSNGICSLRRSNSGQTLISWVLILILMEYALWAVMQALGERTKSDVLILILMEYALWESTQLLFPLLEQSLNPYSNGICSLSSPVIKEIKLSHAVLILILMEYALWDRLRTLHFPWVMLS